MKTDRIKKVLIALDYNPTAQKVAEQGFSLAKTMGAEVILLHVSTDPAYYTSTEYSPIMGFGGYMDVSQVLLGTVDGLKSASQHFLDKTKRHLDDATIQTIVSTGDIAESILMTAKKSHADIIVLGSHSRKWLENIVLGSTAEKVLRQTRVPLFIIPTKKQS
ncbi:MAG TPA: universal stress protein [Prolixibacteraceae bacterium]|nr:universal stress protein [Marinilabiliales bacterium]HBL76106.1 universal stress protein [Prolixibacteraceae bacterium]HCU62222.1 universal stress protein [Prolixibacteraceae bacterium]